MVSQRRDGHIFLTLGKSFSSLTLVKINKRNAALGTEGDPVKHARIWQRVVAGLAAMAVQSALAAHASAQQALSISVNEHGEYSIGISGAAAPVLTSGVAAQVD